MKGNYKDHDMPKPREAVYLQTNTLHAPESKTFMVFLYKETYPSEMLYSCKIVIESCKEVNVNVMTGVEKIVNLDYESEETRSVEIRSSNAATMYPPYSQEVQVVYRGNNWLNLAVRPVGLVSEIGILHLIDSNDNSMLGRVMLNLNVTEPHAKSRTSIYISQHKDKQYHLIRFRNPLPESANFDCASSDSTVMRVLKPQISLQENQSEDIHCTFGKNPGKVFLLISDTEHQYSEAHCFIVR